MPKRKQKREGRSEEKRRAEGTSSYILLETDLRGLLRPDRYLQVLPHRTWPTGLITPVSKYLRVNTCRRVFRGF